jgi:polar amino acid transport system substrate-binding protein
MRSGLIVAVPCLVLLGCGSESTLIRKLDDAQHARIGVVTGAIAEGIAKARFPQAEVKSFDDAMDAVGALKAGQLGGFVTAYPTAVQVCKKNPDLTILPEHLSADDTSVAVRKDNPELLKAVDRIISDLKSDGTLASMKKRWFKQDLSPYEEPKFDLPTEGPPLRIAVSATREPFSFVDKDGRVTGHDGELARRIAEKLHRPIEFSNMKFMALIPALQSGKADLIITGMTATDERRKAVNFSVPYFANAQVFLTRGAAGTQTQKLATAGDIAEKRIGVLMGSAQDVYATTTYPRAQVLQYHTAADIALAVKTGKVDAALYDDEELKDILHDDPSLGMFGDSLFSSPVGVGFNKDAATLREKFNHFLGETRKNGTYADMLDRWITKRQAAMPEIPQGKGGELVIGVSIGGPPFTFMQNNQALGFDIELARRFAVSIGKEARFSDMEFGGLVAAVASHKVDLIISSIFITAERKKLIDFSEPYYEEGTRMFALKSNIAGSGAQPEERQASGSFFQSMARSFRSNIIDEDRYLLIWNGLRTTVLIAVLATVFGTLLGAVICFLRMSRHRLLNLPAKLYISLLRGTPVLVLLMLIFYVVFASVNISPVLVAVVAFGMNFGAYVSEIFRTGIEGVDRGQAEAGIAMGFSRLQAFLYVVLPQTVRRILPVYKGEFISLVKMTSIVGYIAVQDLTKAGDIVRSRTFDAFFPLIMVAILYFTISWVLMQSLEHLERITDPKYRRRKAELA